MSTFAKQMEKQITILNEQFVKLLDQLDCPQVLKDSMNYSLQSGGKRIRPLLIFATLDAFKKDWQIGLPVACAVEMIHTYSLIHDDLPCMDDDDLRRGKPTNHKVFGEAIAVLAGDALLTYSFQIISQAPSANISDQQKLAIIYELAKAAGPEGMVGGQAADMEAENKEITLQQLEYIHKNKTGKLLSFCIRAGAILANADQVIQDKLAEFAYHIGLAFQIRDDILDVIGTSEKLGKSTGSDQSNQKSTYPSLLTLEGASEKLTEHLNEAKKILQQLPLDTSILENLTNQIGSREN